MTGGDIVDSVYQYIKDKSKITGINKYTASYIDDEIDNEDKLKTFIKYLSTVQPTSCEYEHIVIAYLDNMLYNQQQVITDVVKCVKYKRSRGDINYILDRVGECGIPYPTLIIKLKWVFETALYNKVAKKPIMYNPAVRILKDSSIDSLNKALYELMRLSARVNTGLSDKDTRNCLLTIFYKFMNERYI